MSKIEQWEIDLRERLNRTIPEGCYKITDNTFTGKGGYIEFEVAMRKQLEKTFDNLLEELESQAIVNKKIDRP